MARRKNTPGASSCDQGRGLLLTPRDRSGDLPPWTPTPPPDGWTPADAWEAAEDYAADQQGVSSASFQVLTRAAYRELLRSVPGLHRQDVEARLSGVDPRTPGALGDFTDYADAHNLD